MNNTVIRKLSLGIDQSQRKTVLYPPGFGVELTLGVSRQDTMAEVLVEPGLWWSCLGRVGPPLLSPQEVEERHEAVDRIADHVDPVDWPPPVPVVPGGLDEVHVSVHSHVLVTL